MIAGRHRIDLTYIWFTQRAQRRASSNSTRSPNVSLILTWKTMRMLRASFPVTFVSVANIGSNGFMFPVSSKAAHVWTSFHSSEASPFIPPQVLRTAEWEMQIHFKGIACGNPLDGLGPNYFKNMGKWNYCFQPHNSIKSRGFPQGSFILSCVCLSCRRRREKHLFWLKEH